MVQIFSHFSSVLKIGCNCAILGIAAVLLFNGGYEGSAQVLLYPIKQHVLKLNDLHVMQDIYFQKELKEEKYRKCFCDSCNPAAV